MEEIKFKFVLENKKTGAKIVSASYSLDSIFDEDATEKILLDLENEYGCDGNCTNESVNHCECDTIFDDFEVTKKLQYITLKDKAGVEIYEDDLVRNHWTCKYKNIDGPPVYRVVFKGGGFGFRSKPEYGNNRVVSNKHWPSELMKSDNWEVIGNIHENPELLATDL